MVQAARAEERRRVFERHVAGGIVSATHHYWSQLNSIRQVISALVATVLWPLILAGVNLHVH
jgi:hypothetical protein